MSRNSEKAKKLMEADILMIMTSQYDHIGQPRDNLHTFTQAEVILLEIFHETSLKIFSFLSKLRILQHGYLLHL